MISANELQTEIVGGLVIENDALSLPDPVMLSIGKRIHETAEDGREDFAAALIAIATRIKQMPSSRKATTQVTALAAIALGDVALNGLLCKALYARAR